MQRRWGGSCGAVATYSRAGERATNAVEL